MNVSKLRLSGTQEFQREFLDNFAKQYGIKVASDWVDVCTQVAYSLGQSNSKANCKHKEFCFLH